MNERTSSGSTLSVITILRNEYVNILDMSPKIPSLKAQLELNQQEAGIKDNNNLRQHIEKRLKIVLVLGKDMHPLFFNQ
jgi:hypothetical protein